MAEAALVEAGVRFMSHSFLRKHSQPFVLYRDGERVGEVAGVKSAQHKVIDIPGDVEVFVGDWLEDRTARAWLHVTDVTQSKLGGSMITQLTYESGLEYERQEATSQVIAMLDDIADAVWTLSDKKMPPQKKEHVRALVQELQGIVRSLPPGGAGGLAGEIAARFVDGS